MKFVKSVGAIFALATHLGCGLAVASSEPIERDEWAARAELGLDRDTIEDGFSEAFWRHHRETVAAYLADDRDVSVY